MDFGDETVGALTGIPFYPIMIVICLSAVLLFLVILSNYIKSQAKLLKECARPWLSIFLVTLAAAVLILFPMLLKYFLPEMGTFGMAITFILLLLGTLFIGIPIPAAVGFCGIIGIWYIRDFASTGMVLQLTVYPSVSKYLFTVLPLFAGTSFLAFSARLSENLYKFFYLTLGHIRGGLAMATVGGCAGFAAISGDSMSTAAAMGSVALPEMRKYNYKDSLAAGCIAAGGTIGILIPPSIGFIIYGMITEQSIGKLFVAGIVPGVIEVLIFITLIYLQCLKNPALGPAGPSFSLGRKTSALWETWPVLLLITLIIGGIYSGFFTAIEAGGVGFVCALVLGLVLKRLTWKTFLEAMASTVQLTSLIFIVLVAVNIFNYFISYGGISHAVTSFVLELELPRYGILAAILVMYALIGCVMAIGPAIMITLPLVYPVIVSLGFDPIWFGVIMVIMMELGLITPLVGLNFLVIAGMSKVPMEELFKGVYPFMIGIIILVVILIIFPDLLLFLPDSMTTLESID